MSFNYQKGMHDCFPTCFRNAMNYYNVPINEVLDSRLTIFDDGTEDVSQDALCYDRAKYQDRWNRSIQLFKKEWDHVNYLIELKNNSYLSEGLKAPEPWTQYLIHKNIHLDFRNNPLKCKNILGKLIGEGAIIITDIAIPNTGTSSKPCKHAVLILAIVNDRFLIHDPLPENQTKPTPDGVNYIIGDGGSNMQVSIDYFFTESTDLFKPLISNSDLGYKFLIVKRQL